MDNTLRIVVIEKLKQNMTKQYGYHIFQHYRKLLNMQPNDENITELSTKNCWQYIVNKGLDIKEIYLECLFEILEKNGILIVNMDSSRMLFEREEENYYLFLNRPAKNILSRFSTVEPLEKSRLLKLLGEV